MFTGVNDCSRIEHGAGTDLSDTELEVPIRGMTSEAYAPELLVLPRGINALCEDQGMRTAIQAFLPTLDDGGLAVRQVRGDPNRGIWIPGASPDSPRRIDPNSGQSSHGASAPSGRGKEPEVANSRSSRDREEDRSWRLHRGDRSFVGEPDPKHQKTTELWGQSSSRAPPPPPHRQQQPQGRSEEPRRFSPQQRPPPPPPQPPHERQVSVRPQPQQQHQQQAPHHHRPSGSSRPYRQHHPSSSRPRHRHRRC
jgi:hypothetical protein